MNKNKIGNFLLAIALMLLCGVIGSEIQKRYKDTKEVIKYVKTIEKRIDTLYLDRKVIEKEIVYKYKYRDKLKEELKKIVIPDTCTEIVRNYEHQLANCDSIVALKDKIIVKTDSVIIYKDKIIDKLVVPKKKPFGIGVQVGATTTDFKEVKPYIGIGISYNLIRF